MHRLLMVDARLLRALCHLTDQVHTPLACFRCKMHVILIFWPVAEQLLRTLHTHTYTHIATPKRLCRNFVIAAVHMSCAVRLLPNCAFVGLAKTMHTKVKTVYARHF
jgi:hypothetical protein